MKWTVSAALAAFLWTSQMATAQDNNWYLGGKFGGYDVDQPVVELNDLALGAYGGYRFNPYFSVEAEYINLFEDSVQGIDVDSDLWAFSVRPSYPIGDSWEVYAKLGWAWLEVEADDSFFGSATEDDDDFFWGLGTSYSNNGFHIRGEVQADTDVPDFLIYTIGVGIDF